MTKTVAGIYKNGTINLLETPTGVREGRVKVTLEDEISTKPESRPLKYGEFPGARMSTEEDFKIAEWR